MAAVGNFSRMRSAAPAAGFPAAPASAPRLAAVPLPGARRPAPCPSPARSIASSGIPGSCPMTSTVRAAGGTRRTTASSPAAEAP
jgi:hypothetical protein